MLPPVQVPRPMLPPIQVPRPMLPPIQVPRPHVNTWCLDSCYHVVQPGIDGLVQEKCNSIANALELRLSCTNPSI